VRRSGAVAPACAGRASTLAVGIVLLLGWLFPAAGAAACGPDSDCRIGERSYRIALPPDHDRQQRIGAVVYMHGYLGQPAAVMNNKALRRAVADLGAALVAPKSFDAGWSLDNGPGRPPGASAVELRFFDALVADLAARFPIDRGRLLATGFSAGGMMVWTLACYRSGLFAGFAPIAGTFWDPVPDQCPTQMPNLFHVHGLADRTVPLGGRGIGDARQGNVYAALDLYRRESGAGPDPERFETLDLACERWRTAGGKMLEFCVHEGGHAVRPAYVVRAWKRLLALGVL